jgi:hypothetical protein
MPFGDLRRQPNLVILITDQQSGNPHWPAGWADANLHADRRLKEHGLTFTRGYTNACTCTPARATLFSGLYPAQHGAIEVLEFDDSGRPDPVPDAPSSGALVTASTKLVKERRQRGLSPEVQNLAKVGSAATACAATAPSTSWRPTTATSRSASSSRWSTRTTCSPSRAPPVPT